MLDDWPALKKWSPGYLKERFGARTGEVQSNRQANHRYEIQKDKHRQPMRMAEFVDLVCQANETNDYYMTAANSRRHRMKDLRPIDIRIYKLKSRADHARLAQ